MKTELYPALKTATISSGLKETATAFWLFLTSPQALEPVRQMPAQVWRPFLQLFVLQLAVILAGAGLVYGLVRLSGPDPFTSQKLASMLQRTDFATVLLLAAVVAPVVEEFLFRSPLRYSRMRLLVAFLAFSFLVLPLLLDLSGASSLISLFLGIGTIMLALAFLQSERWAERMRQVWQRHYAAVFYTFALAFALVQLTIYKSLPLPATLIPVLVVAQCIGGLFWGYTRLRFGLGWAMLAHALFNALFICMPFLTL